MRCWAGAGLQLNTLLMYQKQLWEADVNVSAIPTLRPLEQWDLTCQLSAAPPLNVTAASALLSVIRQLLIPSFAMYVDIQSWTPSANGTNAAVNLTMTIYTCEGAGIFTSLPPCPSFTTSVAIPQLLAGPAF